MKSYIEVVGESKYLETVEKYVADINIIVRAAKSETAIDEAINLRTRSIETLISNGLEESELKEGGVEIWRDWFTRKKQKVGQESYQKIIICCGDINSLIAALSALEPLFENQRYTFTLDMRQPIFSINSEQKEQARNEAIQNAIYHAQLLAKTTNLEIKNVFQIEELSDKTGASGVYGDTGGGWIMMGLAGGSSSDDTPYINLNNATREIKVRYRVRFSIKPASF